MSDDPNPWSKDIPIAPAPTEFVFSDPQRTTRPAAKGFDAPPAGGPSSGPSSGPSRRPAGDPPPVKIDTTARRRWIGVGAGVGVVVAALVVASMVRSGDEADVSAEPTIEPGSSVLDELSKATLPPTTVRPATTSSAQTVDAQAIDERELLPATWIDGQFALPDRLAAFDTPMQLVALTSRGLVIEIDLPSGATSTLDLDQRRSGSQLHLRDRAALITSDGGSLTPVLVQSGEAPIEVDVAVGSGGFYVYDNGSNIDQFMVESYAMQSGESTTLSIALDGTVSEVASSGENLYYGLYEVITGEWLLYDGGDLFLVSPPGVEPPTARRISTGQLIGRSERALFVSECDAERVCAEVLVDVETGARTAVPEADGVRFENNLQLASMSPDATAVLLSYGPSGDTICFDLTTGAVTQLPITIGSNYQGPRFAWAPDSSGIFTIERGEIVFVDRATNATTPLPIEFSNTETIADVGARSIPES